MLKPSIIILYRLYRLYHPIPGFLPTCRSTGIQPETRKPNELVSWCLSALLRIWAMSTPSETKMDPLYKVPNSGLGRWTKMIVLGNVASEQVCVCVCPVSQFEGVSPPFVAMDTPRIVSHEFFVGGQLEKHQLLGGPSFHQVEIL